MDDAPPRDGFIKSCGLKFPKDPAVLSDKIRRLLRQERYEEREYQAVRALVGPDDTVMELGGGIGFMSSVAAGLCGARHVRTFEANPALLPYIRAVHAANGIENAQATNALLAGEAGPPVDFYVRKNILGSSMQKLPEDATDPPVRTEKVPVLDINEVIAEVQPTVLVCDIEGAEAHLLPMADWTGLRVAVIELHPQWIGQAGVRAVFDVMHGAGLTFFPRRSNKKVTVFRRDW